MIKKLLCFSAALVLCLTSFIIPSFAASLNSYSFDDSHLPNLIMNMSNYSNGLKIYENSTGTIYYYASADNSDTYGFILNNNFIYYISTNSASSVYIRNSQNSTISTVTLSLMEGTDYYINVSYNNAQSSINLPKYDTLIDAVNDFDLYIANPPSQDPIYDDLPDFNIQRGYAAYIDFGSDWSNRSISGTLTSSFPQYSSLISGDWDGTDNRRYFWTDSLPSNTNFTSNVGSAIDWTKVPPYDLLQRSKNGIWFIQSNNPLNRYLVIVNPNQWRYGQNPTDDTINCPITVSDLSGSTGDVQFFALNQKFDTDGTLVSAASDNASNNRTGTYDPDTGQWEMTDSNGNAADQVPGGESDTPVISSITDYIHNISSVLTNFANSVISLIQAPISHISELIEAGSGFMASLRGMYSWLPVDIQGLVISALTVVIGIGVFKVFL